MKLDVILDTRGDPHDLAALGRLAERFGLRGAWVSSLADSRDPFTNLAMMAATTRRLRLGPIAVNPFDIHPVRIASALLTLNELAQGRAAIVIGGGGEALEALGIRPDRRVRAVREAVGIIRAAASGQPLDHVGELYRASRLQLGWLSAPAPLLLVGASQPQMLRMAAACADGIMMSDMPPAASAAALATLDHALAEHGRSRPAFSSSAFTALHLHEDPADSRREARRWLLLRGIFRPWLLEQFLAPADVRLVMDSKAAFIRAYAAGSHEVDGVPGPVLDALVDHVTLCGGTRRLGPVLERLLELRAAGLDSVALRLYANPARTLRLLGREVLPALGLAATGDC